MNTYERIQQIQARKAGDSDPTYPLIIWSAVLLLLCYTLFKVAYYMSVFDQPVIGHNPYLIWPMAIVAAGAWEFLRGVLCYRIIAGKGGKVSLAATLAVGLIMTSYDIYEAFPISNAWGGLDPVFLVFIVVSVTALEVVVFIARLGGDQQQKPQAQTRRKESANVRTDEEQKPSAKKGDGFEILHHSGTRKETLTVKQIKSRIRAGRSSGRTDYADHYLSELAKLNGHAAHS